MLKATRGVVDRDVQELPADAGAVALAGAVTCDAMADTVEPAELLDVVVDHLAGLFPLVAAHRPGGGQGAQLVEAQASQHADDRCRRDANLDSDRLAGQALAAQGFDKLDDGLRGCKRRSQATSLSSVWSA